MLLFVRRAECDVMDASDAKTSTPHFWSHIEVNFCACSSWSNLKNRYYTLMSRLIAACLPKTKNLRQDAGGGLKASECERDGVEALDGHRRWHRALVPGRCL